MFHTFSATWPTNRSRFFKVFQKTLAKIIQARLDILSWKHFADFVLNKVSIPE